MSLLGLFPGEDDNRLDQLSRGQAGEPPAPGMFEGSPGQAALTGIASGIAKVVVPLQGDEPPVIGYNLPASAYEKKPETLTPEQHEQRQNQAALDIQKQFTPDPRTNGWVAQTLFGATDVGSRVAIGSVAGAPGVAATVGGSEGINASRALQAQGVDADTANRMGLVQGAFSGMGVSIPFGIGKTLISKLATGAVTNTGFGIANRAASAKILDDAGYPQMAAQYEPLDKQALVTDAIMGTFFGGLAHLHNLPPSVADTALKSSETLHVEHATDGIPDSPQAREDHLYNFGEAMRAALNGDEPRNLREVATVPDPAQEAARATNAQTMGEVVAEATGEPVAAPAEAPPPITNERRAAVINDTRLYELNAKYDSGAPLDAAEMSEMIKLQRDRALNARVGNRPIRGVLSREGANLALQDRSFSHMTIVDASDFKPINDNFGHPVGDQVIQHIGQTLRRFAPEGSIVEHRGGDEFVIHHDTEEAGHKMVMQANELLALQKIHAVDAAGKIIDTKQGVLLAHGTGTNEHDIETKLQLDKAAQKSAGTRVGSRDQPRPAANAGGVDQRFAQGGGEPRDGGTGRDAAVSEPAVPRLDPETAEAVAAAQRALADNPRLNVPADEETGAEPRAASEALKAALADIADGQTDADVTRVAAACFARTL